MKINKLFYFMTVMTVIFMLAACSAKEESNESTKEPGKTLRIGYINSTGAEEGKKAPIGGGEGWALHTGIMQEKLKEIGIETIEYYAFPNGPDLNEAIGAKEVDVGLLGDTPALLAKSTGYETTLVGLSAVNSNVWLISNKKEVITDVEQLKGKTVATAKGSYMYRYLLGLLVKHNLKDEVDLIHMLPPDAQASLEKGDIAAYAAPTFNGPKLAKNNFPIIQQAIVDSPELAGTSVTISTNAFIKENPKFLEVWRATRTTAIKDLKENLDAYYKYYAEVSKQDLDVVIASYSEKVFNEESFPEEGLSLLEGTKAFLVKEELMRNDFSIDDWRNGK